MIRLNLQMFGKGGSSGGGGGGGTGKASGKAVSSGHAGPGHRGSAGGSGNGYGSAQRKTGRADTGESVRRIEKGETYDVERIKNGVREKYENGMTYTDVRETLSGNKYSYNSETGTWTSTVRPDIQYIVKKRKR